MKMFLIKFKFSFFILILFWQQNLCKRQRANDIGGMLIRSCMYGFRISTMESQFTGDFDRLWNIDCLPMPKTENVKHFCKWTCKFFSKHA